MDKNEIVNQLEKLKEKYRFEWKHGKIMEYHISTAYESFEFDVDDDGLIYNMLHFPPLYRTRTEMHQEFRSDLKEGLTIKETILYIIQHSHAKYKGRIRFAKEIRRKVSAYK